MSTTVVPNHMLVCLTVFRDVTAVMFQVTSGSCTTHSNGRCFTSPNYPSFYSNYQTCNIAVVETGRLSVEAFSTENGYDFLTVNGQRYDGTTGPNGVPVTGGSTITFSTDGSVTRSGFSICLGTAHLHLFPIKLYMLLSIKTRFRR